MMHWNWYGWGMGFGWIFMLAFWAIILFGIIFIFRVFVKSKGNGCESAMAILEKRYARGEISKEEYNKIRDDIRRD
ncbi:MAG: SHOCT domain-containing protein [Nitrospiraceae bacterium]|nr:SHOCT domain-containing protein [Nitrospiraceae bacterium]